MRWRPLTWLLVSLMFFTASYYFWRLGDKWAAKRQSAPANQPTQPSAPAAPTKSVAAPPLTLLTTTNSLARARAEAEEKRAKLLSHRLTNSTYTVSQLAHREHAILLENALLDTAGSVKPEIPKHLQAQGDPGTYIVQSRGALDNSFRVLLQAAGAVVVSYIPNNAYLVRASEGVADALHSLPETQTVLPYEPYYKLKPALLGLAVDNQLLPLGTQLNLLLFSDARSATLDGLRRLGAEVLSEQGSPFGPVVRVQPQLDSLPQLAGLPGVQEIEFAHHRTPANDLSRARVGVSVDTQAPTNYLNLTGSNILIAEIDTGVDTNHPDLAGRVFLDQAASGIDTVGHGTHVAGIMIGSGLESTTVTNVVGSIMPPVASQFRGMAPGGSIFSMIGGSDQYLQEAAARTNALISNNSWTYGDNQYDLGAATYDAAVRDALPEVGGSQPIVFVFPAGNGGGVNVWDDGTGDDGQGGVADTIQSPGTAKNVITVGAIEQFRNVTNAAVIIPNGTDTNGNPIYTTNFEWQPSTDSSNQVASFSSRGNVGISVEGDFGRFKPDVVAPGTFVFSTRSSEWDENLYYSPTSHLVRTLTDVVVDTNATYADEIFIPGNAVQVDISVYPNASSPTPFPPTPIYVKQSDIPDPTTGSFDFMGTNHVSMPRDHALTPVDQFWYYAVGNSTNVNVSLNIQVDIAITNLHGNFLDVLKTNLNDAIGNRPYYYRYESGTSLAAANVSGNLALMEEFLQKRTSQFFGPANPPSPALLKALLINGAGSLGNPPYDFSTQPTINHQGWGLINLPSSLPGALSNVIANPSPSPILVFEQSPTNALVTGNAETRFITLSDDARNLPLKITLAWTDPPGNPVASVKLVNDLDLVVTNLDTGDIYLGNDILPQTDFNEIWNTNTPPNIDVINNVENIFVNLPLGTNYSVTVIGKRVNVNAVTAQTNNVAQDFALVIKSGDGTLTNALSLTNNAVLATPNVALVTSVTNMFADSSSSATPVSGAVLNHQHVGANTPLLGLNFVGVSNTVPLAGPVAGQITLGMTNQWHFYVISNDQGFTNAAFLTFLPPTLSMPRMGVNSTTQSNATREEADIDLYVTTDPGLTNLDPNAVAGAYKSLTREGSETIVLSNAQQTAYYVGVKSESQEAAEYSFLGVFSLLPFDNGNGVLQGFPVPSLIPDATINFIGQVKPGGVPMFAISTHSDLVRRVTVTNELSHQLMGDLQGILSHNHNAVYLNDHSPDGAVTNKFYVYDDSGEGGILSTPLNAPVRHTDGPGTLNDFSAGQSVGQWMLTMIDGVPSHTGTNVNYNLYIEPEPPGLTNGIFVTIQPGTCRRDFVDVPIGATNMTVIVSITPTNPPGAGPVSVTVCPLEGGPCQSMIVAGFGTTNSLVFDQNSVPPLNPIKYGIQTCNLGTAPVTVFIQVKLLFDLNAVQPINVRSLGQTPILDDAVSYSTLNVTNDNKIVALEVGLRVDHPRVSDVAFTLISPSGTRLMLCENRGGLTTNGMGINLTATNIIPVSANGGPQSQTNSIDTGLTSGTIGITWNMYQIPDRMVVYYQGNIIFDTGYVSGSGSTNLTYGPGTSTVVTIVMNPGGNPNPTTAWDYTVTSAVANYTYLTFTENTNLTITPIKFAPPPFVPGVTTNVVVFSDSFQAAAPGVYTNGSTFDGWTVNANQVAVTNDPPNDEDADGQYLQLELGDVSRPLPTQGGHNYVLTFYYKLDQGPYFDGSFENPPGRVGGVYSAGQTFGGWTVDFGDLNDLTSPWQAADGTSFLDMNGNGSAAGAISHPIQTVANQPYNLRFAYAGNPQCGGGIKTMQVLWDGTVVAQTSFDSTGHTMTSMGWLYTNVNVLGTGNDTLQVVSLSPGDPCGPTVDAMSLTPLGQGQATVGGGAPIFLVGTTNWQQATITFTAQSANEVLDILALTNGLVLDNFSLLDKGSGSIYAQPEESLDKFQRENAKGTWTLEMLDSRVGATNPTPTLVSWQLSFIFENQLPLPIPLAHNETVTNTVCANRTQYYSIAVPSWASDATNYLTILSGGTVNLLFSQTQPPTGTNAGDFNLAPNATPGATVTLSGASAPPLIPGATYFIGVQNTNTNCVTFSFTVDFNVTPLTLNQAVCSTAGLFPPQYFSYDVTSNETAISVQLTNLSGNVDLVASKVPFPDLTAFQYGSFNLGTNAEDIVVFTNSDPVNLSPGNWYFGVFNSDTNPAVNYCIVVTDYTNPVPNLITLFNGVPYNNTNNATGDSTDYYQYFVSTNAVRAQFEIYDTNGPVNNVVLVARHDFPLPTLTNFDYFSATNDDLITIFDFSTPVPLTAGRWFVSAVNVSGAPVAYTIKATDWAQYGTNVTVTGMSFSTNGLCFNWDALVGVHYFVQGKTNLLDPAWVSIPPTNTATSITPTACIPLPSPLHFFRMGQRLN